MLTQLTIQNFALIDRLGIEFGEGFNILTGETGAGKSILIDAIAAALGARVGVEMIRSGTERALVEAAFEVAPDAAAPLADWAEDGAIILAREISRSGRSVFRLNGRMCTASTVREVAASLIDLHGQHEHQSLLATERHAEYLEGWAGGDLLAVRRRAAELFTALRETRAALAELRRSERELAQKVDLYRFQAEEIDAAALQPDEERTLEADRLLLASAEKLHAGSGAALAALAQGEPSAEDLLATAAVELGNLAGVDARLQPVAELVESAAVAAQEAARELRGYHEAVEFNPERLQQVMERLEMLRRLKRKYGDSVEEILAYRERIGSELEALEHAGRQEEDLTEQASQLAGELAGAVERVYRARVSAARRFDRLVAEQLRELGMQQTRFETQIAAGDPEALDRGLPAVLGPVEFLISPNPGEPLRPLARIASGGEISRVMLALKTVMAAASPVPTLIFDEIDAGVGGRTAEVLGRKLASLGQANQVLCITHLPQIACLAAAHFQVRKQVSGNRTVVHVSRLEEGSRVAELARMLGGAEATATRHAEQLLAQALAPPAVA
jgi:DNA repair protein RecN (Recombination protein N)